MKLEQMARGERCYIGCPECARDPEQTVLCHIRRGNVAGIGQKPHSLLALPGCSTCNAISDGNMKSIWSKAEIDAAILKGYVIWLWKLIQTGKVEVN